jgi:putative lipoprotein
MSEQTTISGDVQFEPQSPPFRDATLRIQLQEVTLADAPARVVAEQVVERVSRDAETPGLPFSLASPNSLDPRATYILQAHVDLDGSGEISPGDFITMETHSLPTGQPPAPVELRVRQVR